jgi:outer membrane protein assembly factor BamB
MRRAIATCVLVLLVGPRVSHALPVPVGRVGTHLYAGIDPRHPMPADRGGAERTGRMRGVLPSAEPRVLWDLAVDGAHPHGPIVDREGRIFVTTTNGVLGLSRDGEIRFDQRLGPVDVAPALLPSGELVVLSRDRTLTILSVDGVVRAQVAIAASARAAPLVLADGAVLVAALDRSVTLYDTSLSERFRVVLEEGSPTTPSLAPTGRVVVGAGNSIVWIDTVRGVITSQMSVTARAVGPAIAGSDGTLFQLLVDGTVVAFDEDGMRWQQALGGRAYEGTAMALASDGTLRVAIPTVGVVCLGSDGTPRWTFTTDAPFYGTVAVDEEGNALAVDRRGRLTIIDPSGALRFRVELAVPVAAAAIMPGRLIVATDRPAVMAMEIP